MQAKREADDSEALAGLVPSKLFWETREQVRQTILTETESAASRQEGTTLCCAAGSVSRNSNNKRNRSRSSRSGTVTGRRELGCVGYFANMELCVTLIISISMPHN